MSDAQFGSDFVFGGDADAGADGSAVENTAFQFDENAEKTGHDDAAGRPKSAFPEITKLLEDTERDVFNDPAFYKKVFADGGDSALRLNTVFQKYATAKDPSDKTLFRQQMTNAFWDYLSNVAK